MNGSPNVNAPLNFDRAQLEIGLCPASKCPVSRVLIIVPLEGWVGRIVVCSLPLPRSSKRIFSSGNGRGYAQIEVEGKKNSL